MRLNDLSKATIAVGFLLSVLPAFATAQETVDAVWVPRHVTFVYQGFTTHYSCSGLRERIEDMLRKLGAHELKIRTQGCTNMVGVEYFPGVRVTMRVLVPASAEHGKKANPIIRAHWRNIVLMPRNADLSEQGNCELIEQFKETFLPLFTTRHISYQSHCVPHQLTLGTHLSAEVLMPAAKPTRRP